MWRGRNVFCGAGWLFDSQACERTPPSRVEGGILARVSGDVFVDDATVAVVFRSLPPPQPSPAADANASCEGGGSSGDTSWLLGSAVCGRTPPQPSPTGGGGAWVEDGASVAVSWGGVWYGVVLMVADVVCLLPPPQPSLTGGGGVSVVVGVFCCSVVRMFSQSGAGRVSCASGWKGSAGCSVW